MIMDGITGGASQNLYGQFLYRITEIKKKYKLTQCKICLFSPTLFLTGSSWKVFRNYFLKEFSFNNGFQFNAKAFNDVSGDWGISFTIWDVK